MHASKGSPSYPPIVWIGFVVLMIAAGGAIPLQGRVNAALGAELGDPYLAALLSFGGGLALIALIAVVTRRGRATMRRVPATLRSGAVRPWYLLVGLGGAYFVLAQTLTIGLIGVAVFTVSVVTGQTVGGLLWDRIGLGPAGRIRLTALRVISAVLTVLAVLWAVSPQLQGAQRGWELLLLVVVPFSGGFINSGQQAINGRQTAAYRSPIPSTLFNFLSGTAALAVVWIGVLFAGEVSVPESLPSQWWLYLGGPLGVVFIGLGALLVTRVGVLVAAMGMIAGQLVGSLLLDVVAPAPGSVVTTATVLGTALTLAAVALASLPDMLRARRWRR